MRILDFPAFKQGSGDADSPRVPGRERDPWARQLVRSAPRGRVPLTIFPGPGPRDGGREGVPSAPSPHPSFPEHLHQKDGALRSLKQGAGWWALASTRHEQVRPTWQGWAPQGGAGGSGEGWRVPAPSHAGRGHRAT